MEWALELTGLDFSNAERYSPVWAAIYGGIDFASLIPPENHFLAQAGDTDRAMPNFI